MTSSRFRPVLLALAWLLLTPLIALAQAPEPGPAITILGQITNGTPGEEISADLSLMLHTYDGQMMIGMTDGTADAEGRFRFENVETAPGRSFEVMVTYRDVTYFSERIEPEPGQTELDLPVTVYETTTDTSTVQVEQLHMLLDFTPGMMQVIQIYILSNTGDRAVVARDQEGLRFRLPPGASEVSFRGDRDGTRFIQLEDGFIDTAPVAPGKGTLSSLVRYVLPYEDQIELAVPVDYPVLNASVLLPDVGVTLSGAGWSVDQEVSIQGRPHQVYSFGHLPLEPGDALRLTVTGRPEMVAAPADSGVAPGSDGDRWRWVLMIGLLFSVALIGVGGFWWWRDRQQELAPVVLASASDELPSLFQAIADLDDAYQAGTIDEAEYQDRRARLHAQAMALLAAEEYEE